MEIFTVELILIIYIYRNFTETVFTIYLILFQDRADSTRFEIIYIFVNIILQVKNCNSVNECK